MRKLLMSTSGHQHQDFSDATIRRFLLGQLNADEQPTFEERLFLDEDLEARVRLAELELADDYAFARLRADQVEGFEQRFLSSSERKLKLGVSSALRERFARDQISVTTSLGERLRLAFSFRQPVTRIAFAAMLAILVGGAWLAIKREPRIKEGIKWVVRFPRAQPQSVPRESSHAPDNSAPEHRDTPPTMPDHDRIALSPTIKSIALPPDVSLESGKAPSISLTTSEQDILRLELAVKPDPSGLYQAQLSTINGQDVLTAESLRPIDVDGKINFDVPATLLKAGDYRVKLSRIHDGSAQALANYYFRVK
jgi:hypothetical protein